MDIPKFVANVGPAVWSLAVAVAALIALAVTVSVQGGSVARLDDRARTAAVAAENVADSGLQLLQVMTVAEADQRGYLLTGERRFLGPEGVNRAQTREILGRLHKAAGAKAISAGDVSRIEALADRRLGILENTITLARAGRRDEALAVLRKGEGIAAMNQLRERVTAVVAEARTRRAAVEAEREALRERAEATNVLLGLMVALSVAIAAAAIVLERITARRAAAAQKVMNDGLLAARQEADRANESKSRFLAAASHDMRQPLHALALYLATLQRRVQAPDARAILHNMDGAVRSMTRMFAALLDLARLEAGVLKPELADFAVGDLLDDVAGLSADLRSEAPSQIRLVPTGLRARSDPDLLEIIVRNLASNAAKHSGGGRVLIGCRRAGDMIRIEVHDTGPGIPREQIPALFAEFVRGQGAGSTEGIGLGLSIVNRLARLLGHEVSVRSTPGRGSVFSITFPRSRQETPAEVPPVAERVLPTGVRILVADDEPWALDAMRCAFEDAGAVVTTARSAEEVRLFKGHDFDLYVFDRNLGEANGLDLLREIEAAADGPVRAMIVTGSTTPHALSELRAAGRPWMTKPLAAPELLVAAAAAADETLRFGT